MHDQLQTQQTNSSHDITNLPGMKREQKELPSGYLGEYLWRERYKRNGPAAFENILSHIAEIYPEDRVNQPGL